MPLVDVTLDGRLPLPDLPDAVAVVVGEVGHERVGEEGVSLADSGADLGVDALDGDRVTESPRE